MNRLEFALASILDADTALWCVAPWLPDGSSRPPPLANGPGPGDDDEDDEDEDADKGNIEPDDDEGCDDDDEEDDDEEPLRCVGRRSGPLSRTRRQAVPTAAVRCAAAFRDMMGPVRRSASS